MSAARRSLVAIALLIVFVAGCGGPAPSPSPSPASSPAITPVSSPVASRSPTARPPATPSETPSGTPKAEITDLPLDIHRIDSDLADHIEAFTSLGDQIVWSGGPRDGDENLYRYVPGAAAPELLFSNPTRSSFLSNIRGSAAGYVFTDERWKGNQRDGWRLWFIAAAGGPPILLDQSTDDRLIAPTIAMDDRWIAWEVVHGTFNERSNELRAASVDDALHPLTLLTYPGRDVYLEYPALWQDELWYGIADNDWVANTEKPRVEMIDLGQPTGPPAIFGADQRAFMPAPGRAVVAWKSGGDPSISALNYGTLTLYWRATGQAEQLPIPGPQNLAERISFPSVGNRFVCWWDDIRQRLYVYDLAERQFRRIAEYDPAGDELVARPSLSGDLLAYLHYLPSGQSYLEWATLPD